MHVCNCLVAVGGDVSNKVLRKKVSVPELMVLSMIHGHGAITEIEYLNNSKMNQLDLRENLLRRYPKYTKHVIGIWQDNGGKYPGDVRKLGWPTSFFKVKHASAHDAADTAERDAIAKAKKGDTDSSEDQSTEPEEVVL